RGARPSPASRSTSSCSIHRPVPAAAWCCGCCGRRRSASSRRGGCTSWRGPSRGRARSDGSWGRSSPAPPRSGAGAGFACLRRVVFEGLQSRLGEILTRLRGRGSLSEGDVEEALREVRLVLLEADVNFKVAREFVARVREAAVGQEIWKSLTPGQQVVQIVFAELTRMLGATHHPLRLAPKPPTVVLLIGL